MTALPSATRRAGRLHATAIAVILAAGATVLTSAGLGSWAVPGPLSGILLGVWILSTTLLLVWVHAADAFAVGFAAPLQRPVESAVLVTAAMALLLEGALLGGGVLSSLGMRWLPLLPWAPWFPDTVLAGRLVAGLLATLIVGVGARGWVGSAVASILAAGATLVGVLAVLNGGATPATPVEVTDELRGWFAAAPLLSLLPLLVLAPAFKPPKRRTLGTAAVGLVVGVVALALGAPLLLRSALGAQDRTELVLLACWTPAVLLAVLHRLVVGYEVAAGIERSGLFPTWLVRRSRRLGTPVPVLILQLLGMLGVIFLLDVEHSFASAVALAGLATGLFAVQAGRLGWQQRRWWVLPCAAVAVLGASTFVVIAAREASDIVVVLLVASALLGAVALGVRASKPHVPHLRAESVEALAASSPRGIPILTLHEALEVADNYKARVLVATLRGSHDLMERAALRAEDDRAVFVLFVDEIPGMFYPPHVAPSATAVELLLKVCSELDARGYQGIPIWRVAHDVAASIAQAARDLHVDRVIVDVGAARPLGEVLRGGTLSRLRTLLGKLSLEVVRPESRS
ncbi:MAG: hypothetical protein ABIJ09_07250 [Pseudomonadota bacterium]